MHHRPDEKIVCSLPFVFDEEVVEIKPVSIYKDILCRNSIVPHTDFRRGPRKHREDAQIFCQPAKAVEVRFLYIEGKIRLDLKPLYCLRRGWLRTLTFLLPGSDCAKRPHKGSCHESQVCIRKHLACEAFR